MRPLEALAWGLWVNGQGTTAALGLGDPVKLGVCRARVPARPQDPVPRKFPSQL